MVSAVGTKRHKALQAVLGSAPFSDTYFSHGRSLLALAFFLPILPFPHHPLSSLTRSCYIVLLHEFSHVFQTLQNKGTILVSFSGHCHLG